MQFNESPQIYNERLELAIQTHESVHDKNAVMRIENILGPKQKELPKTKPHSNLESCSSPENTVKKAMSPGSEVGWTGGLTP